MAPGLVTTLNRPIDPLLRCWSLEEDKLSTLDHRFAGIDGTRRVFLCKWVPWEISPRSKPHQRIVSFFFFLSSLPVVLVTPPSSYELSHCVHSVIRRNILFPLVIYPAFVGPPSPQRVDSSRQLPGPSHPTHRRIFHFSLPQVAFSLLTTTSLFTFQAFPGTFSPGIVSGIALNHDTLFSVIVIKAAAS